MDRRRLAILAAGLGLLLAAACTPVAVSLPPTPTPTVPAPTGTPTRTPVWFPPTPTFTPYPTPELTPTVDVSSQMGTLLFEDTFDDASLWELDRTSTGSAAINNHELTLAVSEPGGYVFSLRKKANLDNFYAEITASTSLCRGEDEYGLLLRVSESQDFYRFSLTCNGQFRIDKVYKARASSPMPLTQHGSVPPGAPSSSRLSVLADGQELEFFINGEWVFTLRDPSLPSGSLGVFARSNGENAVTINFSDLKVYQSGN